MQLTLRAGEGEEYAFWATRRQWLGLLRALVSIHPEITAVAEGSAVTTAKTPFRLHRLSAEEKAEGEPFLLKAIRLQRRKGAIRLALLLSDEQGLFVDLHQEGIPKLQAMLRQQAERAGWDVEAALVRLSSAQLAKAAVRKAGMH